MQATDRTSASISLLCVEDDQVSLKFMKTALCAQYPDMPVYCADNGAQGQELFKKFRPKIVITDISMQGMDGIQLSAEIKSLEPETVIIAVSAFGDTGYLLKAIAIGVSQYLIKPLDLELLFAAIDKHLEAMSLRQKVRRQNDRIRKLSLAVEESPSSVVIIDADGIVEFVNSKFAALTGYSPDEVIGRQARPLMSGPATMESYQDLWRTVSSGSVWQGELQSSKRNHDTYWVSMVVSPISDDDGTTHYVSVREDITSRKIADQEHESTIEILRMVNASAGIEDLLPAAMLFFKKISGCSAVGIRLREGEDYPYYVARGFPAEFVLAEQYLCSKDDEGLVVRDACGKAVLDCMCGKVIGGQADAENPCFTAYGSFWTNSTTALLGSACGSDLGPLRNRCNTAGFESIALIPLGVGQERLGLLQLNDLRKELFSPEDIAHWETMAGYLAIALVKFRSEESLRTLNEELELRVQERTSRLEAALHEQESFSYSVSHDLRAPLRHINSYLAILEESCADILPAEAHLFLERSRSASERMGVLIDDLLELSKISRTTLVKVSVDLSKLATHACDFLHESEPERRVEIVIDENVTCRGDRTLLNQMIGNLLGNAWKYSAANPTARIEFGREVIADREAFFVRDNGVGFDMAYKEMLFGAFQRLHGSEYQGNGIGLATVKRIIERHGGKIWAESKIDEGSTFYFIL